MKINKVYLFWLIFSLSLIVLILSFVEILLRREDQKIDLQQSKEKGLITVFGSLEQLRKVSHAYSNYELVYEPYLRWKGKPNQSGEVLQTNSSGYRNVEFLEKKQKNIFRIIITGNSFSWGYGASSNGTTISGYLEQFLNKFLQTKDKATRVEVINMADLGYVSLQELILWNTIVSLQPDLVIHLTGYNDARVELKKQPILLIHRFIPESILQKGKWSVIPSLVRFYTGELIQGSSIYRRLSQKFSRNNSAPNSNYIYPSDPEFLSNMRSIAERSVDENIPLIVVLQPTLFTETKPLAEGEKKILSFYERADPKSISFVLEKYKQYHTGLLQLAKKYNFIYINGSTFFPEQKEQLYIDGSHVSDEGYAIIAKKLATIVKEYLD